MFTGTLADLPELVAQHEVHAPTLVIVGEVVQLRDKLAGLKVRRTAETAGAALRPSRHKAAPTPRHCAVTL